MDGLKKASTLSCEGVMGMYIREIEIQ